MFATIAPETIELFHQIGLGSVEEAIYPKCPGRVYFQATYWPAEFFDPDCQETVLPGDPVAVIGRSGITLLVAPRVNRLPKRAQINNG
ncbi:MAG: hypothetical protein HC866_02605 [Leptolyngbyaceae cyanobacterium RU_5_1]|nr:hypothetical protein [Leptolyngbyaceae cyanobacterium RU_5_1]